MMRHLAQAIGVVGFGLLIYIAIETVAIAIRALGQLAVWAWRQRQKGGAS